MGKSKKTPAAAVDGRVLLVQGDKPLLYPRYNSVEELLKIGKGAAAQQKEVGDAGGATPGERPSKKQKRLAAATPGTEAQADDELTTSAPAAKGYGAVGEDGLTYKQRRQMRRAAERAAKAEADAAAAAAGEAAEAAPKTEAAAEETPKDERKEKKKKRRDSEAGGSEEGKPPAATEAAAAAAAGAAAAGAAAAAAAAKGNAEEAARIRAALGFTAAGHGDSGGFKLSALVTVPAGTPGTGAAAAGEADAAAEPSTKKQKKDKEEEKEKKKEKKKKDKKDGASAEGSGKDQAEGARPVEGAVDGDDKPLAAAPAANGASAGGKGDKGDTDPQQRKAGAVRPERRARGGAGGSVGQPAFNFDFKVVNPEVEAETDAKLARLMALDSAKDGFVPRRVWVSGMPREYDEETVREYWGYCGEVEAMHLMTFSDSGNFNGTAFITFKTQEGYEAALACHGEMLEERALRVEKCKAAAEFKGKARAAGGADAGGTPAKPSGPPGKVPGYPVAYCGNIAFEVGVEELKALFAGAGAVPKGVKLHTDKATGRSKGYAHVHFASDEDVDKAISLNGTTFRGRQIRVSYAQPKAGEAP